MEKCKTLGSGTPQSTPLAYFKFSYSENELTLNYGYSNLQQSSSIVNDDFIYQVIQRVEYLREHQNENLRKPSYYTRPKWQECINNRPSPYVAKLILDVFPDETIERIKRRFEPAK